MPKLNDLKNLQWILKKTKSQVLNFIMLNLINIVYSILSIYLILVSKNVIDAAVSQSLILLRKYIIELIVICFIEIGLKTILSSINAVTCAKLELHFKQDILNTILKKDYEHISKFHSGELMTRIVSDVNIIIDTLVALIPNILSMLTKLICALILLFHVSKELVVLFLIAGCVLFVVVNLFKPFLKKIHKKLQEASSNVRLLFKEIFDNLIVIKIFSSEDVILAKSRQLQDSRYDVQMKRRSLSIASSAGFNIIYQIGYFLTLIWGAYNLYLQNITVGGLTSIVQLITQVQAPIIGLSRSFQSMFAMLASAERLIELEELKEDVKTQEMNKDELYENLKSITLSGVSFTYKNKKIFDVADFEVAKGEIVAIYGESGIGKSTLLKLILGIIQKDAGEIGFSLKDGTLQEVNHDTRNMFAYVPQGKFILSGTIRENITFVNPDVSEEALQEALAVSNCTSFMANLPNGLDTKIGERGSGLSEGQLQRLAIARALVSGAPILILDEITSSLDSKTEEEVLHNIKNLKNRTCIIVTHRNSISKICDKEFMVEDMKIREKGKENERK